MAELIRELAEEDIPCVRQLLAKAGRSDDFRSIERLGGMTNRSYHVVLPDGEELLVRIPGEGTEEMISRSDERKSTELACRLGIDTELFWFGDDGTKVMRFIRNPQPVDESVMKRKEVMTQAAAIFRRLHSCGEDTGVPFEVFDMAALYERIIRNADVAFYPDYDEVKQTVMTIKEAVNAMQEPARVPCHNDSLMGNWILDENGRLYLIDWEYSGMNEAMWDLSCLSIEADFRERDDANLLKAYYGREPSLDEKKRFAAAKLYVDYLWTLWGLTRVPYDGEFMQEYADGRYLRLKKNIDAYQKLG